MQYQQAAPAQPSKAGLYFQKLYKSFLVLLKQPATAGRQFIVSADYPLAIGYIVLQAILVALFGTIVLAKVGSVINSVIGMFAGSISMPYAKAFFGTLALSAVFSFVLAGILLAANLIFKNTVNYMHMLCAVALRSIVSAPVIVVAMLLALINPVLGIVVFFAANIWGIIVITQATPAADAKAADHLSIALFLAFLLFMVVSLFVMSKCIGLYSPIDVQDMLSDIMQEMY